MKRRVMVNEAVAEMRREPDHASEQVSQIILGSVLQVLSTRDRRRWFRVQSEDGYKGWVRSWSVQELDPSDPRPTGPMVEVDALLARVRARATGRSEPVREAPVGSQLPRVGRSGNWIRVELPDNRRGYLHARDLLVDKQSLRGRRRPHHIPALIRTAHRFLGVPYQWGGVTPKGVDCSGFVQTVFRLHGIVLPRDSGDQFKWVQKNAYVSGDVAETQYGHLLFFGESRTRISHVALGLRDGRFIHASGRVRINSLHPDNDDFNRDLYRLFLGSGPVLLH